MKKIYKVGGYVRDRLLGIVPKDIDYVVVGSTPEEMLADGFIQVGADFPVFLHPETGDEYALARKERKVAAGYHGFETDFDASITLKEDLIRRDLTINSMALDEDGKIIDPFDGYADLSAGILRHTSEAFAEDPLRVLRVARFAARYADFTIHPETMKLMKQIVEAGELEHLAVERIWTEFEKALSEKAPFKFIAALLEVGALRVIFPELIPALSRPVDVIKALAAIPTPQARFSYLLMIADCKTSIRIPNEVLELAVNATELKTFFDSGAKDIDSLLNIMYKFKVEHNVNIIATTMAFLTQIDNSLLSKWGIILACCVAFRSISFNILSEEQKSTLKGKEIADVIRHARKFVMEMEFDK